MAHLNSEDDFDNEDDLETFLELALPQLLASLDTNLLIFGRQVFPRPRCRIDLLAIGSDGTVFIIELKYREALPGTTAQVLDYLSAIEDRSREEFVRLAIDEHGVDLLSAFERRFGHPLPERVNQTQHVIVIAQSFDPRTERSLEYLQGKGHPITAYQYDVTSDGMRLTPACIEGGSNERSSVRVPLRERRRRSRAAAPLEAQGYRPRVDVQLFLLLYTPQFIAEVVILRAAYAIYQEWLYPQIPCDSEFRPLPIGSFARQLRSLLETSGDWTRVFLLPGTSIDPFQPLPQPPSTRTYITDGHRIVAYQWKTPPREGTGCN